MDSLATRPALGAAARPKRVTQLGLPVLLPAVALALLSCLVLAWLSIARVDAYRAGKQDLDIQAQVIWNTARGHPFASSVLSENDSHLAEHLAFSLVPLAGAFALLPDARLLVAIQALALAASSLAIFLYARERLGGGVTPLVIQAAYLAAPVLANTAFRDFHPVALAALPLAFGAYLLLTGRTTPGLALLALAVAAEEEAALPIIGLGLLLAWQGRRRLGLALAVLAVLFLLLAAEAVMPAFQSGAQRAVAANRTQAHYSEVLASPGALADRLGPSRLADAAQHLLLPGGGLALLSPTSLLPAAPTFVALMLQDSDLEPRYKQHWAVTMLPFLAFAAADGARRLSRRRRGRPLATLVIAAGALAAYLTLSPLPGGGQYDADQFSGGPRGEAVAAALALVPRDGPVAASGTLVGYVNLRPQAYVYPPSRYYLPEDSVRAGADWPLLLDLGERETRRTFDEDDHNPLWRQPGLQLFSPGWSILLVAPSLPSPSITAPAGVVFGGAVRLEGYDVQRRGGSLVVTLHWLALEKTDHKYLPRLELVGAAGPPVAAWQGLLPPNGAAADTWRPGLRALEQADLPLDRPLGDDERLSISWVRRQPDPGEQNYLALPNGQAAFQAPLPPSARGDSP